MAPLGDQSLFDPHRRGRSRPYNKGSSDATPRCPSPNAEGTKDELPALQRLNVERLTFQRFLPWPPRLACGTRVGLDADRNELKLHGVEVDTDEANLDGIAEPPRPALALSH